MTVSSTTTPTITYNGNGSTTAFSTVFVFLAEGDLVVTLIDSGGTETVQTITTEYTVSGGDGAVGTVTMVTAPASGEQLRIDRVTAKTQLTDYIENDSFPAESHELALDRLTLISQELSLSVSVSYPITIAQGGTGATTAAGARTALGLVIGTDVQAYNANLAAIVGLSTADGTFIVGNGSTWVAESGATVRTSLGLGDIATQNASSVSITGGSITGITDLALADGGTGASTAAGARTNLGLGDMATQSASSVAITGGSISGITDLAVADGGTGASTASGARTALGLVIGTDVQAYDSGLNDIAGLSVTDGNIIVGDGVNWVAESGATARTSLGLGSIATQAASSVSITGGSITGITDLTVADGGTGGSSHTAYSVICGGTTAAGALQSVSGVGTSGQVLTSNGAGALPTWQTGGGGGTTILGSPTLNNFVVGDGADWQSTTPANARTSMGLGSIATQASSSVTITGGSITGITDLAVADGGTGASTAAGARTALGLVIGTDVQAYDAGLADIAGLAVTDGNIIVGNGTNWVAESGATARTSLGLGSIATQASSSVAITGGSVTGITDITVADGGTGRSSHTAYAVLCGGTTTTGAQQSVSGVGTSGQVLTSNGAGALPTWQAAAGGGGGAWTYVSGSTASNSSSIDFTGLSSSYIMYRIVMTDVHSASDFPDMLLRTSTDNGTTWDSGATDYSYTGSYNGDDSSSTGSNSTGNSKIVIARELGTATNEHVNGMIDIYNPSGTNYTMIRSSIVQHNYNGVLFRAEVAAQRESAADVDGVRILLDGANIASGSFKLYGLNPS